MNNKLTEFEKKQRAALERMEQDHLGENQAAKMVYKGTDDYERDVLTALYTDFGMEDAYGVLAEYMFFNLPSESGEQAYTSASLTLAEELWEDGKDFEDRMQSISGLFVAVGQLNALIPFGAFGVDIATKSLMYKLSFPVNGNLTENQLYDTLDSLIGHALHISGMYIEDLVRISRDELSLDEFLEELIIVPKA